jgi:hypothetical protein
MPIISISDPTIEILQLQQLELLLHFVTETCHTLSNVPAHCRLWQKTLTKEAVSHPFLMYSILAISALHIGYSQPIKKTERYIGVAQDYHRMGSQVFRTVTTTVTEDNCHAIFAFCSMTFIFSFAAINDPTSLLDPEQDHAFTQWVGLLQGMTPFLLQNNESMRHGKLAPLFAIQQLKNSHTMPEEFQREFERLSRFCQNSYDGESTKAIYATALEQLRLSFMKTSSEEDSDFLLSSIFLWIILLPKDYISLLELRRPEAMSIFAFYCVQLHKLDSFWWARGVASRLITDIEQKVKDPWKCWIQWPLDQIRGKPKALGRS